jgi:hypothetical protein
VGLLDSRDGNVKNGAMRALGRLKDERAVEPLVKCLESPGNRFQAAEALKEMGAVAQKAVCTKLRDKDRGLQIVACQILQKIATEASHPELIEAAWSDDDGVAQAAREALPEKDRPPVWGPNVTMTLNIHLKDNNLWPEMEKKLKALTDHPRGKVKVMRSGDYLWVTLKPVNTDAMTFSRKVTFMKKLVAVHTDQRLIYFDSGK